MATADSVPIRIQRADFLATVYAVFGSLVLLLSGWMVLDGGGGDLTIWSNTAMGIFWLGAAGYSYLRPEMTDKGTEPAPLLWFKFAGVVVAVLTVGVCFVVISEILL